MTSSRVDVMAAAITDARGRVLLARRTEGRDLAGLWEFPGGKREPGESPEQALARELQEELGIDARIGAPLIAVAQQYPHKRLRLDVRHVTQWQGTPRGHEGQALAWVPQEKLVGYAMPPADRPVVAALLQPDRYLVTPSPGDPATTGTGSMRCSVRWMPASGACRCACPDCRRTVVARWSRRQRSAARPRAQNCWSTAMSRWRAEFGIGLHLRAAQLRGLQERPVAAGIRLAASCHDADELRMAEALGCDFAVVGPLKPTPTHPEATRLGWARFEQLREQVSLPIYAIGGLGPDDIAIARQHGAQGIAAIRGLWLDT